VEQITGDITDPAVAARVLSLFRDGEAERLADLIVCDGAPDVSALYIYVGIRKYIYERDREG